MICPRCQQSLSEDARFCSSCGLSTTEINFKTEIAAQQETIRFPIDQLIGRILDSKYELVERLGEGGMGVVYRAHRLHIGGDVAIKVLHPEFVRDTRAVERFRREARSAAMIRHPNVVTIHDFNEARTEGGPAYIVMELVSGMSLRQLLRQEARLPPHRAMALMEQICSGVAAAHRQGIVHRDLKPDNVIIERQDETNLEAVKVLDFGLAKLRDLSGEFSLTQTGAMVGTPSYLSPEQCRGEALDARSDVYALGAMLHEMLTGQRPFAATTIAALITQHLNDPPPPFPPALHIPSSLEATCRRALSKSPNERQTDAAAFGRELHSALTSAEVSVATAAPQKKPGLVKWLVMGILLISLGAVVAAVALRYARKTMTMSTSDTAKSDAANVPDVPGKVDSSSVNANAFPPQKSENASPPNTEQDLIGTWKGSYGPLNRPATLLIEEHNRNSLSGVLEQGGTRVSFVGKIDESSREITFKETKVINGSGWSLGENKGELSADRRKMSGTGKDATGSLFGVSYEWSFSKP